MVRRIGTAIYCLRTGSTRRFKSVQAPKPNSAILRCGSDGIRVRAVDPFNPLVDREFLERSDNSIRCLSATQPAGGCAREGTCDGHWSSPWRSRTRRKSQLRSSLIVRPRSCNGLSVRVPADHGRMVIRQELPRSGRSCRSAGFGRSCTEAAIHGALGFGWVRGVLPFALRVAAPRSTAARPPGWHASGIAICYRHVESHHRLGQSFQDECVDLVSRRHRAFQVEGRREWRVNRGARATDRNSPDRRVAP